MRRIATRRFQPPLAAQIVLRNKPQPRQLQKAKPVDEEAINWRYVTGTFQIKIPIAEAAALLPAEENTLAILKWRLENMPAANKQYPVLQRYVDQISTRVLSFGGDPATIPSSPEGYTAPGSSCKWWSGLSIVLLAALVASLGALTGSWLTIVPPILAVLTLIAESVWVGRCRPRVCAWLRNAFTGGVLGALVLALLILFGITAPQAVLVLCVVVVLLAIVLAIELLNKCR